LFCRDGGIERRQRREVTFTGTREHGRPVEATQMTPLRFGREAGAGNGWIARGIEEWRAERARHAWRARKPGQPRRYFGDGSGDSVGMLISREIIKFRENQRFT
jgi:hypothetical protein